MAVLGFGPFMPPPLGKGRWGNWQAVLGWCLYKLYDPPLGKGGGEAILGLTDFLCLGTWVISRQSKKAWGLGFCYRSTCRGMLGEIWGSNRVLVQGNLPWGSIGSQVTRLPKRIRLLVTGSITLARSISRTRGSYPRSGGQGLAWLAGSPDLGVTRHRGIRTTLDMLCSVHHV
jgi:hypothetical protein